MAKYPMSNDQGMTKYVVGTSGFSFPDWVGTFYPDGTSSGQMFSQYVRHFGMVELNFTFYAMPGERTYASFIERSRAPFEFWVKLNRQITHEGKLAEIDPFLSATRVLRDAGRLAGLILQFPQSFKRTVEARKYLASALDRLGDWPAAVEFRDRSWDHSATYEGLRQRDVTLVVPDAPAITGLFRPPPMATSKTGYLRLHSRNADNWYAGEKDRYDYNYTEGELRGILDDWQGVAGQVDKVYAMFNNCHRGQAAQNAEAFRRILDQIQ